MASKPTLNYTWKDVDDDGELTPLESSDEESEPEQLPPTPQVREVFTKTTRPSTQQATKQSRDRIAAKSSPYLKSPRTATYSLSSLHDMMVSGTIDLDPEYQRAVVWPTIKQEGLIDSLFHNFYVPPIIFATTTREDDGAVMRTCIDGKQRLTSMRLFMDGELSHKDSLKGNRSWFINPEGSKRRLISPQWQSKFKQTQIACVEYDDLTEEQQREIFQRVQMGVTLTPAERLQSANGPIADLIREVRVRVNSTEGLEGYLDWGKARGKDFKSLAEIAYLITHGKTTKSEPTVVRLNTFLDNKPYLLPAVKRREGLLTTLRPVLPNLMDNFCRILQHPDLGEPLRKNISPLEFVMSAYLIYVYSERLSDAQLSDAIAQMRQEVQRSIEDMKDNAKRKLLLKFIHKTMPKLISKGNADAFQVPFQRVKSVSKFDNTSTKPATKRKRNEPEDEKADSDDEPLVKKLKVKPTKGSSSALNVEKKAVDIGQPSKTRALTKRPQHLSAKTAVKRTPSKQLTTSTQNQTSDVKKPQAPSKPASKSEGFQVATPSVEPSMMRKADSHGLSRSQQVLSKLGSQSLYEPVALGRRAEAARTAAALNQAAAARQTQASPPTSIAPKKSGDSPVVEQSTLYIAPSTSPEGVSRMTGSTNSGFGRAPRVGPDRLAPIREAKAAASSGSTTMVGFPQASRPGSVNGHRENSNDADMGWQKAFADLLPAHSRITEESTTMVSSRVLAPRDARNSPSSR